MVETKTKKPAAKSAAKKTAAADGGAWSDLSKANNGAKRLIVYGQGETAGRKLQAVRIRESLLQRLSVVAGGSLYQIVEVALEDLIQRLEASDEVRTISADQLRD